MLKSKKGAAYLGLIVGSFLLIFNDDLAEVVSEHAGRLLNFDSSGSSIAVRLQAFTAIDQFFGLSLPEVATGISNFKQLTVIMPHNMFLEGLLAHGLLFALILSLGFFSFTYFYMLKTKTFIGYIFIPIIVGAQFSGTFFDNYPAIICCMFGVSVLLKKYMNRS